jgi:hypothetical protein
MPKMPTAGSEFGIDSDTQLGLLPWATIRAWRPAIPANRAIPNGLPANPVTFAGRYFNPWPGNRWADGENVGVRQDAPGNPPKPAKNPDLKYVFPIQGYKDAAQNLRVAGKKADGTVEKDAAKVQSWGAQDAKGTCKRIMRAIDRNELKFPFFKSVIVYLDVESGVKLSQNYWYGWASAVYWYSTGFFSFPFYAGVYCTTLRNPTATGSILLHRIPSDDVRDGLTKLPNNLASKCYGIWATNPWTNTTGFDDPAFPMQDRFAANFRPDWENRFDVWQQTVHIIFGLIPWSTGVPVRLWQYAASADSPTLKAMHVDLVEKSPDWELISRMLELQ